MLQWPQFTLVCETFHWTTQHCCYSKTIAVRLMLCFFRVLCDDLFLRLVWRFFLEGCLLPPACEHACSRIVGGLTLALYTYTHRCLMILGSWMWDIFNMNLICRDEACNSLFNCLIFHVEFQSCDTCEPLEDFDQNIHGSFFFWPGGFFCFSLEELLKGLCCRQMLLPLLRNEAEAVCPPLWKPKNL